MDRKELQRDVHQGRSGMSELHLGPTQHGQNIYTVAADTPDYTLPLKEVTGLLLTGETEGVLL